MTRLRLCLSTLLILSGVRTVDDGLDWYSPRSSVSAVIIKNIYGHASYTDLVFYGDFVHPPQRRLLEHPRRVKQVYRSHDYVARGRRRPRNKLDEGGRPYRSSAVKNNEDEDEEENEEEEEEEEEENAGDEEDELDDEDADEETAAQNEEETVAVAAAARNRVARSGYVPHGDETGEREGQEVVKIRSATEECEDEPTEPSQYYEYETEVRNVASQDTRFLMKILGASSLILLFA